MIIGLINLVQAMEQRARQRSSLALERSMDLTPPTTRLVTDNGERFIPLAEVQLGMTLRLNTGDLVPVDGKIVQGDVWLDEAMLTGEAVPQQKSVGDTVYAGKVVGDGSVLLRAAAIGSKTKLARIINLVRQAQSSKLKIGQLAARISAIFVPAVVALISAILWYFFGPYPQWGYTLVIARHYGVDHRLPVCPGASHADINHRQFRPCGLIRCAGTRCRCIAAGQLTRHLGV